MTKRKVGKQWEYTVTYRCACGHEETVTTLGAKLERSQVAYRSKKPCQKCRLAALSSDMPRASSGLIR